MVRSGSTETRARVHDRSAKLPRWRLRTCKDNADTHADELGAAAEGRKLGRPPPPFRSHADRMHQRVVGLWRVFWPLQSVRGTSTGVSTFFFIAMRERCNTWRWGCARWTLEARVEPPAAKLIDGVLLSDLIKLEPAKQAWTQPWNKQRLLRSWMCLTTTLAFSRPASYSLPRVRNDQHQVPAAPSENLGGPRSTQSQHHA